jgi:rhodanese-related sulfurtransferase
MSLRDKLRRANKEVASISADEAASLHDAAKVLFLDVRELQELERDGTIPGAVHASRGFLEFAIDPQSPAHKAQLVPDADIVVFCASGMRSLLAAQTMMEMGLNKVRNLEGGFMAWRNRGGRTTSVAPRANP